MRAESRSRNTDSLIGVAAAIAPGNSETGRGTKGDWLTGGNDVLSGGAGDDTNVFNRGDGDVCVLDPVMAIDICYAPWKTHRMPDSCHGHSANDIRWEIAA